MAYNRTYESYPTPVDAKIEHVPSEEEGGDITFYVDEEGIKHKVKHITNVGPGMKKGEVRVEVQYEVSPGHLEKAILDRIPPPEQRKN